jgi:hypothetical protein
MQRGDASAMRRSCLAPVQAARFAVLSWPSSDMAMSGVASSLDLLCADEDDDGT